MALDGAAGWAGRTSGLTGLPAANAVVSISAWVKLNGTAGNQNMVALVNSGAANGLQLGLRGGNLAAWIGAARRSSRWPRRRTACGTT